MSAVPTTDLPIEASIEQLRTAVDQGRNAVLVAPPGSGKTTVVPLRLLDRPWLDDRKILVLEPRRLATRAAAHRMADLTGTEVGGLVGYTTRDDRSVSAATRIEVVTEGVLTRRLQSNPELPDTAIVIFDEFHERNLQTDVGLALALDVQRTLRDDLRILIMSATVDAERIAAAIGSGPDTRTETAPMITSDSRQHPVDIRWAPAPQDRRPRPRRGGKPSGRASKPSAWTNIDAHIADLVTKALDEEVGDILVFLPGMGEIKRVQDRLASSGAAAELHRLHGSLPVDEQHAAIMPSMRRKVVLSTDIAETSLTVEGVRVVVDSGLARSPRFDARTGMTRLQTVSISKASADQRAGRAGRTEPGVVYRAWSSIEHATRKPHTPPEITQVDLTGLVLELRAWGVRNADELTFLDPPDPKAWNEAVELLTTLGVLAGADDALAGTVTERGKAVMRLPVHPRLGRMIVDSGDDQWLACILAALIDERDIYRGRPSEVPTDLALRVGLIARHDAGPQGFGYPSADRRTVDRVRRTANDLARRARINRDQRAVTDHTGLALALAYPDRLAVRRGSQGRFQLRTRTTAWMPETDTLSQEEFLVVADLDGQRKDARIRLAAALDRSDLTARFADQISTQVSTDWDGGVLMATTETRLGGVTLNSQRRRAEPGVDTATTIADRIRNDFELLQWDDGATMRNRVRLLHQRLGSPWPDWSDKALARSAAEWIGPSLLAVSSVDELNSLGVDRMLERTLDPRLRPELDRLAPTHIELPAGRRVEVDYGAETPTVSSRAQDFFGLTQTPTVAGEPVLVELLSPAGRPVQVTQDLAGFWDGSWADVRKDMAGRYPKHDWPKNPGGS